MTSRYVAELEALKWLVEDGGKEPVMSVMLGSRSNALVMGLRLIAAHHVLAHADDWSAFLDSPVDVYFKTRLMVMGQEAEGPDMQAMAAALDVCFETVYLNSDGRRDCPRFLIQGRSGVTAASSLVTLLLRPGHYDVLFPCETYDFEGKATTGALVEEQWRLGTLQTVVVRFAVDLQKKGFVLAGAGSEWSLEPRVLDWLCYVARYLTSMSGPSRYGTSLLARFCLHRPRQCPRFLQ